MSILQNPFGVHAQAFQLREQRTTILASNIANVDTPHYKARDMDFKSVMRATSGPMRTNHRQHFSVGGTGGDQATIKYRLPHSAALDGNTVEVGTENALFTDNAMRYQATSTFLNSRIRGVMTALRGE